VIAAVFPAGHSEKLADGLALSGATVLPLAELSIEALAGMDIDVLVAELGVGAMRQIREVARIEDGLGLPILLVADSEHLVLLESAGVEADFVVAPVDPIEFRLRLHRLTVASTGDELLRFKDLELNPLNYQATLAGQPMDLTFMEYELLRFLVENPVRVWSREQLLSRVWGYEYYGGARTVDVHVRRLRAKLGEERASWITTIRSVGYRWG
jgi:DNA-binding response OmpR family regulator